MLIKDKQQSFVLYNYASFGSTFAPLPGDLILMGYTDGEESSYVEVIEATNIPQENSNVGKQNELWRVSGKIIVKR